MSRIIMMVGTAGPAFSGKDTVCNAIRATLKKSVHVIDARFAEPIYEMVRALVPWAYSGLSKEDKERALPELGFLSIRQMMFKVGEAAREVNPACWIDIWRHQIIQQLADLAECAPDTHVLILVPDLRKDNEREAFHQLACSLDIPQYNRLLTHMRSINGPTNSQVNAATEQELAEVGPREWELFNDHRSGVEELVRVTCHNLKVRLEHIDDLFDFPPPAEIVKRVNALASAEATKWELMRRGAE